MFSADTDFWVASQHLEALETTVSADDSYIACQQVLYTVHKLCTLAGASFPTCNIVTITTLSLAHPSRGCAGI